MSSQTEENVQTSANVDELAKLGIEQLEALRDDHAKAGNDSAADALQKLIDERKRLEDKLAEQEAKQKAKAKPPKPRKGSRAPKGRQIKAAASFNQDPENLARLKRILEGDPNHDPPIEPVIQADGSFLMTPWLVQLGISGYYDERRREDKADKKEEPAPIIPPAADATGESGSDQSEAPVAEAPVVETPEAPAPEVEAPAAPAAEEAEMSTSEVNEEVEQVEASAPPMPINPYGTDGDDE